jgi:hypothetical protein
MPSLKAHLAALSLAAILSLSLLPIHAQQQQPENAPIDSDHDGISDATEQALLQQFAPTFFISRSDCANLPAEFDPLSTSPHVLTEDGTIYGQVFPSKTSTPAAPTAEIHYYHLWKSDCGLHSHPLDTEHVAVLVRASTPDPAASWKALYWYAAAHENTVCDVSQIARASTLNHQDDGARVWISPGKHASYFSETLCQSGCGADRCQSMVALAPAALINLGEPGAPMNGSQFIASTAWPLAAKMSSSNFPPQQIARLDQLPENEIVLFNTGRHPMQGVIAISSATEQSLAGSGQTTTTALSSAADSTADALSNAGDSTTSALHKTFTHVKDALTTSTQRVQDALQPSPKSQQSR